LERLFGVLLMDPGLRRRAFLYLRNPRALDDVPEEIKQAVYIETDPQRVDRLAELKEKIRRSGYPVHEGYPAR
jgi:hypothetical protein